MDFKEFSEGSQNVKATVKTDNYSWGKMKTVHHGSSFSIPLHPEHHEAIAKLKDQQEHKFKDETGRHWTAKRDGEDVHFQGANGGNKTKVAHKSIAENAPVAPVPDKKYIKGTPENKALKALRKPINGHPTNKMKEETMPQSFKGFLSSLTELTDKQKKHIDKNNNGKIDGHDFKLLRKEDDQTEETHQSKTTMKHIPNASPALKKAAKDIKPGVAGYRDRIDMLKAGGVKEEVELQEANHREFAQQGKMHPDMAKHMKAGQEMDFYHSKTGDKISGIVKKNDGKEVHVKAHKDGKMGAGDVHKFTVSSKLDESTKVEDPPFDGPYKKVTGDGNVKDKSGAVHTPMSRARDLARKAMQKKMKEDFNIEITEEQAADLCDVASINEKMDMSKADMGDVIKDFQKSDAPQFAGKSDEKRREMAIAAKMQAGGKKSYREFVELIAPTIQEGSKDEKVVDVAENAFDYKNNKGPVSSGRYDVKQDGNRTIVTRKYNPDTGHSTGTDDEEKPAAEKRGRGRPAGSTSGAKQKGSGNKSDYRGIDRTTHALHLPNNNK